MKFIITFDNEEEPLIYQPYLGQSFLFEGIQSGFTDLHVDEKGPFIEECTGHCVRGRRL